MKQAFRNLLQALGCGPTFTPGVTDVNVQAKAAEFLRRHGSITNRDIRLMGCNSPTKVAYRLRKLGVIALDSFDTWERGKDGTRYKRYFAT